MLLIVYKISTCFLIPDLTASTMNRKSQWIHVCPFVAEMTPLWVLVASLFEPAPSKEGLLLKELGCNSSRPVRLASFLCEVGQENLPHGPYGFCADSVLPNALELRARICECAFRTLLTSSQSVRECQVARSVYRTKKMTFQIKKVIRTTLKLAKDFSLSPFGSRSEFGLKNAFKV